MWKPLQTKLGDLPNRKALRTENFIIYLIYEWKPRPELNLLLSVSRKEPHDDSELIITARVYDPAQGQHWSPVPIPREVAGDLANILAKI